jgi:hypothetical protein
MLAKTSSKLPDQNSTDSIFKTGQSLAIKKEKISFLEKLKNVCQAASRRRR